MTLKLRLSDIPLFKFVDPKDAERFSEFVTVQEKNPGDVVLMSGEVPAGLYIVATGLVGVYKDDEAPVATIGSGGALGEMSLIEETKASATIRALEPTRLVFLHKERFVAELEQNVSLASSFFRGVSVMLSKRLRNTTRRISEEFAKSRELKDRLRDYDNVVELAEKSQSLVNQCNEKCRDIQKSAGLSLLELEKNVSDRQAQAFRNVRTQIDQTLVDLLNNLSLLEKQQEQITNVICNVSEILSHLNAQQ